jgi:transcriptional regulator with XRE-family HTH domain
MADRVDRRIPPAVGRSLRQVGEDIRTWRKLRGLTQEQLSERADISLNTLRRLESGDGGVSLENLTRTMRGLGILDQLGDALDPYESDVGRLRSAETLPARIRPRRLDNSDG